MMKKRVINPVVMDCSSRMQSLLSRLVLAGSPYHASQEDKNDLVEWNSKCSLDLLIYS